MKYLIISLLFVVSSFQTHALDSLTSPFPSTVRTISIPNTHIVSKNIIRGMAPLGRIQELVDYGITDILIFKNQTRNEIDQEMKEINEFENHKLATTQFDFFWHKFPSYKQACEKTIDALRILRKVSESAKRKIFFHCTVGEDRTGYLAGLWLMLKAKKSKKAAFYGQMCANGYGRGNPNKPAYVVNEIRKDLSPLFMYMAKMIEKKKITLGNLTKSICKNNIPAAPIMKCEVSSKL